MADRPPLGDVAPTVLPMAVGHVGVVAAPRLANGRHVATSVPVGHIATVYSRPPRPVVPRFAARDAYTGRVGHNTRAASSVPRSTEVGALPPRHRQGAGRVAAPLPRDATVMPTTVQPVDTASAVARPQAGRLATRRLAMVVAGSPFSPRMGINGAPLADPDPGRPTVTVDAALPVGVDARPTVGVLGAGPVRLTLDIDDERGREVTPAVDEDADDVAGAVVDRDATRPVAAATPPLAGRVNTAHDAVVAVTGRAPAQAAAVPETLADLPGLAGHRDAALVEAKVVAALPVAKEDSSKKVRMTVLKGGAQGLARPRP